MVTDDIREAIKIYLEIGLQYRDIVRKLAIEHGVLLSLRHLKRLLRELGLFRRKNYSDVRGVVEFIHEQIQTSGKLHGYRWMHGKCLLHHLHYKVGDVRIILAVLDPEGNAQRRKRRLLRRSYSSKGPNYLWHLDGYDKLKKIWNMHQRVCGWILEARCVDECMLHRLQPKVYWRLLRRSSETSRWLSTNPAWRFWY